MRLIKTVREILAISENLRPIFNNDVDYDEGDLYMFEQTWGSTALGFGGIGGSAMTSATTYVFIPAKLNQAYVYFGGTLAYVINNPNERFREDLRNRRMASVMEQGRYLS